MTRTVVCVLRSSPIYGPSWVRALFNGVREHLEGPFRFVCLSDVNVDIEEVERIPLLHDWPGWWSKLELFRPNLLNGVVLYLDLDTLPVGDLSIFFGYEGRFAMLRNLGYRPSRRLDHPASGVMMWQGGTATEIYDAFSEDPTRIMRKWRGDQEWLRTVVRPDKLQDLFPDTILSCKYHCKHGIPDTAHNLRLVCGHGTPRFNSPQSGWAHDLWGERAGII